MPLKSHLNQQAPTTNQTGFGVNSNYSGGRFFNKDGTPNLRVEGVGFFKRLSIYDTMLRIPFPKFMLVVFLFYLVVNLFFASLYMALGVEHLGGIEERTVAGKFWEAFFFSAQTLSTVGYGHVYPLGMPANTLAAIESLLGLLLFALATGMLYGRFSRPKAYLKFSKNALFSPYKDGTAIMFRLVPFKHNHLTDAEVKVTLAIRLPEGNERVNRFFNLNLEIDHINSLTLSWTVVHPITENSPFYNLNIEDLMEGNAEMLVHVRAFDESFSSYVISKTSYIAEEFIYGAKFKLMYHPSGDNKTTVLELNKLNKFDKVGMEYSQKELP